VRRRGGGDDGHAAGGSALRGRGRRANGRPANSRAQPSGGQLLNQLHVAVYVSGGCVGLATRGRERRRSGEATQKDDDVPNAADERARALQSRAAGVLQDATHDGDTLLKRLLELQAASSPRASMNSLQRKRRCLAPQQAHLCRV